MIVRVTCRNCQKQFPYNTDSGRGYLRKAAGAVQTYIATCPQCGTLNEIQVPQQK